MATKAFLPSVALLVPLLFAAESALAQAQSTLQSIPRIDVHAHAGNLETMGHYVQVGDALQEQHRINLSLWIDLRSPLGQQSEGAAFIRLANRTFPGRFMHTINDYDITDGLRFSPETIAAWSELGIAGYKIWVGVSPLVDDPANDPTFAKLEELGLPGASVHISQPYPTRWCEDPVEFWKAQNAWERVLDRHPSLIVVNAHMLDHFYSDEQLDYLRYVLETYPNVHVDLAARFQQFHLMDRDNLRDFMITYADRILFGTDISDQPESEGPQVTARRYLRVFRLLETDEIVEGGFFGGAATQGLALPQDVLEKIYFRNAVRIYPGAAEALRKQGFDIR
jgi:predicted TIM-barrel fold metal-dependent hydrolase